MPDPNSTTFCSDFFRFVQGVESRNRWPSATASSTRPKYSPRPPAHGVMAPSSMDRSGSRTTSSGSTSKRVPSPSQLGQAPYGELKLKLRGASSSNDSPHVGQARCWLKVRVSSSSGGSPSRATSWTSATPSASRSAVSSESVSRRSIPSRLTRRSTTTSMVWIS